MPERKGLNELEGAGIFPAGIEKNECPLYEQTGFYKKFGQNAETTLKERCEIVTFL